MMTFEDYIQMRADEGLWLNDKNAVVGLSRTAPPTPPKKVKPPTPPKLNPVHTPTPARTVGRVQNPVGDAQFPDALTMMARMGINLVEPSKDEMKRMIERGKKQLTTRAKLPW
jgi:hypothetical protein